MTAPGASGEPLLDARDRAGGRKVYFEDLRIPDLLEARILRSPHAHARIVSIDTSRAAALPGVVAIITGRDAPRHYGVLPIGHDETALAVDRVRHVGQEVAAVAARSTGEAEEALQLIDVEYEPLPAHLTARAAMASKAPWIHDDRPGNVEKEYHHVFGDPDAGFAEAAVVVEDDFHHPRVTHAAMEPHGVVARFDAEQGDGFGPGYTVWTSTQTPRHVQRGLSLALGCLESEVRVIPCAVGGGFGGKSETFSQDVCAALLARITGQPVRARLTREEVFFLHRGRPESFVRMRLGVRADGRISAVACETIQDGGAFCGYGVATILYSGALLGAIYDIQNIRYDGYRVLTNKPACGPMRGHGTIGARHAFESLLDRAAIQLGIDPIDIRRANLLRPGSRTVNELRVTSYGYPECLDRVEEASGWRRKRAERRRGRGIGVAGSHYVSGAANSIVRGRFPHSTVEIRVDSQGRFTLLTGAAEIGQGSDTALAIIAAQALGTEPSRIRVISGDTGRTPLDLGSYSSRVTFMAGNATLEAARALLAKIDREGTGKELCATGSYTPPTESQGGKFPGAGVGPGVAYSYAAQAVEVEVDEETGVVRVLKIWAAHDCGKAINPMAVRGQVEGSVWMGLGQALSEEIRFSPQGLMFNSGLLEYKVPGPVESPPVEVIIVESHDPEGPLGAKEAGEGSLAAVIPALTNAIHDAVGVWITDLPVTPDKILAALREKHRADQAELSGVTAC